MDYKHNKYKTKYLELKAGGPKDKTERGPINLIIKEPWFSLMEKEEKTCEARLNVSIFKHIHVNDSINVVNKDKDGNERKFKVKIMSKHEYMSFEDLLEDRITTYTTNNIFPNKSKEESLEILQKYFSNDDERENGVVAYNVKKMNL